MGHKPRAAKGRRKIYRWEDAQLIELLQKAHLRNPGMLRTQLKHEQWHSAAVARFGSIDGAVRKAGLPEGWPWRQKRRWSRAAIVAEIRDRVRRGLPASDDSNLAATARRYFGSFHAAAAEAGVEARWRQTLSRDELLEELQRLAAAHGVVTSTMALHAHLRAAARTHFGSFTAACSAAGVNSPSHVQTRRRAELSAEAALTELRAHTARLGRVADRRDLKWFFHRALIHHFGSLPQARAAAGLDPPEPRRRWNAKLVLAELRAAHGRGVHLTHKGLCKAGYGPLATATTIYCGGLARARRLAGVPHPRRPEPDYVLFERKWDAEGVIEVIQRRHAAGQPLAMVKVPTSLSHAAARYLGGWRQAVEAAGIDYATVRLRPGKHDEDDLARALRALAAEQPTMTIGAFRRTPLGCALARRFASIEDAVREHGIRDWPVRVMNASLRPRQIKQALRDRLERGLGIHRAAVSAADRHLSYSIDFVHPEWAEALRRLGFADPARYQPWTRRSLIEALAARQRAGHSMTESAVKRHDPLMYAAAIKLLRSWKRTLAALARRSPRG